MKTDWQIDVKAPLAKWKFKEVLTGTWEEATRRAAEILDSEEGKGNGIYQVRVSKFRTRCGYTYIPQWLS